MAKIDELYVVAGFAEPDGEETVEERTAKWEAAQAELKRRLVDEGETAWLASTDAKPDAAGKNTAGGDKGGEGGDGWLAGMLDTIMGRVLQLK